MSTKPDPKLARLDDATARVSRQLAHLGRLGLQRISPDALDELRAAAQVAHAGGLIRVERQLQSLATHAERALARDPLFDARDALSAINRAWLLLTAVEAARRDGADMTSLRPLLGAARRSYTPVDGPLEIQVVSASGWVSDSGYVGYTLHAHSDRGPLEVVAARPTLHFGDDPRMLWRWPLHDRLELSAEDLAHGAWTLHHAKASDDGRLSIHGGLVCAPAPYQGARAYADLRCADGQGVVERLRAAEADPTVGGAGGALVYFEPSALGELVVDHTRARATLPVRDAGGAELVVAVPLARWTEGLVENMRRWVAGQTSKGAPLPVAQGLVAQARAVADQIVLFPHTLVYPSPVRLGGRGGHRHTHLVHLGLEALDRVRAARL